MYKILSAVFILLVLLFVLCYCRKRRIICRISRMPLRKKQELLNGLAEPFGFYYDAGQDAFTSRTDAWQKAFGYGRIYDLAAPSMNMALDTEPVYFNYRKKTWLIQFWKGQYGITTGAEVGIYHADSIIPPALRSETLFQAAGEEEMLPLRIRLCSRSRQFFSFTKKHWWLTGFCIGTWHSPSCLSAEYTIAFPDMEMCASFLRGLNALGYPWEELQIEETTVRFTFSAPKTPDPSPSSEWRRRYALWKDRLFCWIYQKYTAPFSCTADKMLYLYYCLPYAFRRAVCPRTFKRRPRDPSTCVGNAPGRRREP